MVRTVSPVRRCLLPLALFALLAGLLPLQAARAQEALPDLAESNANATIRPTAYGDRTANTVNDAAYANGLAGAVFEARRGADTVARCTTGTDGTCDLRVRRQNGLTLRVVQVAAPTGWQIVEHIAYGGGTDGSNNTTPDYAARDVTIPNTDGSVTTLTSSGGNATTYDWTTTASNRGHRSGFLNRRVNPPLPSDVCTGIDIAVVLDVSASVNVGGNLAVYRDGVRGFVESLLGTPHRLSTFRFGNTGQVIGTNGVPGGSATWLAMDDPAQHAQAVTRVVNTYTSGGGSGQFPSGQSTNWDQGFSIVRQQHAASPPDLVVFVTDGNPTLVANASQDSPVRIKHRDVTYGGASANALKALGTRIVAVGAGDFGSSMANLQLTSGLAPGDLYTGDFSQVSALLQQFIGDLCGGTVTVQKLIEAPGGARTPATGWDFAVTGPQYPTTTHTTAGTNGNVTVDLGREGTVTIVEDLASQVGFEAVEQFCTSGGQSVPISPVAGEVGLSFQLGNDQSVNCVFVNREIPAPLIEVTKDVDRPVVPSGEDVTWSIVVRNVGTADLIDVTFADAVEPGCVTAAAVAFAAAHPSGVLPAGGSFAFDCVTIGVTEATTNVFEASGAPDVDGDGEPDGPRVSDDDSASVTPVRFRVEVDDDAINAVGDPHVFTVTVTCDGGDGFVPVGGEVVELSTTGSGGIALVDGVAVGDGDEPVTCTTDADGTCRVTILSEVPGTTTLTARHTTTVGGVEVVSTDEGIKHWAAIELVKEARIEPDADGVKTIDLLDGDEVVYDYTITNVGPVDLLVTSLEDDRIGTIELPAGLVLAPGGSTVVSVAYTVTDADREAGEVVNVAIVTAEAEDGTEVTDDDDERVVVTETEILPASPDVAVDKQVVGLPTGTDGRPVATVAPGGTVTITYAYVVTNTGNEPLVDLTLVDDRIGDLTSALRAAVTAAFGEPVLPMGASVTVTATDTTTAADLAAGEVVNVVVVEGSGEDSGLPVRDDDEAVVVLRADDGTSVGEGDDDNDNGTDNGGSRPGGGLPRTGAFVDQMLLLALLLGAMGAGLLWIVPRRDPTRRRS